MIWSLRVPRPPRQDLPTVPPFRFVSGAGAGPTLRSRLLDQAQARLLSENAFDPYFCVPRGGWVGGTFSPKISSNPLKSPQTRQVPSNLFLRAREKRCLVGAGRSLLKKKPGAGPSGLRPRRRAAACRGPGGAGGAEGPPR